MQYYVINHTNNEMEGYHSSLDESNDNFNFNDDYDDDAQSFSRMSFLSHFFFNHDFQMYRKLKYAFGLDEFILTI